MEFDMSKDTTPKKPSVIRDNCGTTAGSRAHYRRSEISCQPCRDACNQVRIAWRVSNREKENLRAKELYLLEPSKKRDSIKNWRKNNPEKSKQSTRNWRENNPERYKETQNKNRRTRIAREHNAPSEPYTIQQILDLYGTDCHLCHEPIDLSAPRHQRFKGWERGLQLDHVIPLSKGGSNLIENVKPSHGLCNLTKRTHLTF